MGGKPSFFYFYNYFSSKLYTSPRYYIGGRKVAKGHWSAALRQFTIRISLNTLFKKGRCSGCSEFMWLALFDCFNTPYTWIFGCKDADQQVLMSVRLSKCPSPRIEILPSYSIQCNSIKFQNVPECSRMFKKVQEYSRMFQNVPECWLLVNQCHETTM